MKGEHYWIACAKRCSILFKHIINMTTFLINKEWKVLVMSMILLLTRRPTYKIQQKQNHYFFYFAVYQSVFSNFLNILINSEY